MSLPDWIDAAMGPLDEVFALFDQQDSGNVAAGVRSGRHRWFVKWATTDYALEGLIRAAHLHRMVTHPTIVPLEGFLRSAEGTALVFPWVDGRLLYAPQKKRRRARSAPGRFRALPVEQILQALDALFDAHCAIEAAGFVSSDFYDGSLIYDFEARLLALVDLDEYRFGPFVLETDRALGSTRFMAPEEFRRGATIDGRTSVYHMARSASILLDEGDDTGAWRASGALHAVARRGQAQDPADRFESVAAFTHAWTMARQE